ncbi:MAG: hypothetical protein WAM70_16470 [Pyrinomonadaceae bacterium]
MKTRLLVVASMLFVGIVTLIVWTVASKQQQSKVPSSNRLKWHAAEAKKSGKQRVVIPAGIRDYLGTENNSIDQVFSDYTVVVARPVGKWTYQADDNSLITWHKFTIVDAVTKMKSPICLGCLSVTPPSDIPVDFTNEFLVPRAGGTMTIDGVEVEQSEAGFPDFQQNENYLLFISLYPNRIALTAGGPLGVYRIDEKENVTPFANRRDRIQEGIETKFNNSLPSIKQHLKKT